MKSTTFIPISFAICRKETAKDLCARMKRNRHAATLCMTKLLVRTSLTNLYETKVIKNAGNFARFEHRNISHKIKP